MIGPRGPSIGPFGPATRATAREARRRAARQGRKTLVVAAFGPVSRALGVT